MSVGNPSSAGSALAAEAPAPRLKCSTLYTFAAGHGFVKGGSGSQSDDASDGVLASQSLKFQTFGAGSPGWADKLNIAPTINLTGKQLVVWVKIDDPTRVNTFAIYVSSSVDMSANFRLFTISASTFPFANPGDWYPITLNWADGVSTGAPDRTAIASIRLYHKDNSAGGFNAWWGGIQTTPEPANGVVSLSFDDADVSQWAQVVPYLGKYGYRATFYPIVDAVGASGLTVAQLQRIQLMGHQVAAHANTTPDHAQGFPSMGVSAAEGDIQANKQWLRGNGFDGADDFAWPLGAFDVPTLALARKYFRSGRTISSGSKETYPPADPLRLRCFSFAQSTTVASAQTLIQNAMANNQWLIFCWHKIVAVPGANTEYSIANFQAIIDYLNAQGAVVKPVGEVLREGVTP